MLRRHVGVHWWYSVTYLRKNQTGNHLSLKESFRTSSRVSPLELFQVKESRMRSLFLVLNFAVGYRLPQYEKTAYGHPLDYENEPGHGPKHGRRHEHGHKYGTETKMLKMNRTKVEDKFWKLLEFTLIDMKKHDDNGSRKRKRSKNESPLNRAPRDGVSWNKMRNTLAKYRTYKAGNDNALDGLQAKSSASDWKSSKIKRYSRKRHDRHEDITSVLCQLVEFYQENGTHKQKNLIRSFLEDNP